MNDYPIPPQTKVISKDDSPYRTADVAFDNNLAQSVFTKVLAAIKGNGLDPKQVTLKKVESYVLEIYGCLHLRLGTDVAQSKAAGRAVQGDIISAGQLPLKIEKTQQDLAFDTTMVDTIARDITFGSSKGFGLNSGKIQLPVHKTFIEQENCHQCAGKGQAPCATCLGKGQMACYKCKGSRFGPCMMCRSTGRVQTPGGGNTPCNYCQGRGQMPCDICRSQGYVACTSCGAAGVTQCAPCGATGKQSQISNVSFYLTPQFQLSETKLPPALSGYLQKHTDLAALAVQKFFDIKPIPLEDSETLIKEKILPPPKSGNFLQIGYRALCPYARLTISLAGKKDILVDIAGYKGHILKSDPFLDVLMKKPLLLLQKGAKDNRHAASAINKAAKWKTARLALAKSIKYPPKKAAQLLLKAVPIGLSGKYATVLCQFAHLAIKRVTRLPRYVALGVFGLTVSPIALFLWFSQLSPKLFSLIPDTIPPSISLAVSDIVFIGILCIAHIIAIRLTAFLSLKQIFQLLGVENSGKTWPNAGKTALYSMAINVIIAILLLVFAIENKPAYFSFLN